MLDYLGTTERLTECMAYYHAEYEDDMARQRDLREKARDAKQEQQQQTPVE